MRLLLLGRSGSINHWLEDAAEAFRQDGHEVRIAPVRRPWLAAGLERAFVEPLAENLATRAARFSPDLILAIGGLHVPLPILERLAVLRGRPPLAGWVGDTFAATARDTARLYDLLAYTDTGLAARHAALGFASRAIFLPHAASAGAPPPAGRRSTRLIFVGAATPGRRKVISAVRGPLTLYGPGWRHEPAGDLEVHPGRVAHDRVSGLYAAHLAVLNIKSEQNVLAGLNQRSFDPYLSGTPVLSDAQDDLELCFTPGEEVLVWRDPAEINTLLGTLLREPSTAARIGDAGRRRVMAEHLFTHRLARLRAAF